jgi:hypothetical protein
MTTTVSPVTTVHEQMHTYAQGEQRDQQSVARKDVSTMLKNEQECHCPKERQERYPRARLPEATAARWGARSGLMLFMLGHFLDTPISNISIKPLLYADVAR